MWPLTNLYDEVQRSSTSESAKTKLNKVSEFNTPYESPYQRGRCKLDRYGRKAARPVTIPIRSSRVTSRPIRKSNPFHLKATRNPWYLKAKLLLDKLFHKDRHEVYTNQHRSISLEFRDPEYRSSPGEISREWASTEEPSRIDREEEEFLRSLKGLLSSLQYDSGEDGDDESKPSRASRKKHEARRKKNSGKTFLPPVKKVLPQNRITKPLVGVQKRRIGPRRCQYWPTAIEELPLQLLTLHTPDLWACCHCLDGPKCIDTQPICVICSHINCDYCRLDKIRTS